MLFIRTHTVHSFIHIHLFTHTYIHTYIHTFKYAYIHTYIHTYIKVYIHTFIHTYIKVYIHTYIHTYLYIHDFQRLSDGEGYQQRLLKSQVNYIRKRIVAASNHTYTNEEIQLMVKVTIGRFSYKQW